jgi:hypothetical protein
MIIEIIVILICIVLIGLIYQQFTLRKQEKLKDDELKQNILPEIGKKIEELQNINKREIEILTTKVKEINELDLNQQSDVDLLKNKQLPELSSNINNIQTSNQSEINKLKANIEEINKLNLSMVNDIETLKIKIIPSIQNNISDLNKARTSEINDLKKMVVAINELDTIQSNDISKLKTLIISINDLISESKINFGNWSIEKDVNDLCVKNSSSIKKLCIDSNYTVKLK